ncbi:MAG TPA: hypothetical protein VE569_04840, partial [Acidimicrobiia bacterium]|nr:hypothetical protein [Acidimicrobiia bacterium]
TRVAVWLVGLLVLLAAAWVAAYLGKSASDGLSGIGASELTLMAASMLPPLVVIGGVAFLASSGTSLISRAVGLATGFTVASYFLNFASLIWEPMEPLGPFSIFHYAEPAGWATKGVAWGDAVSLLVVGALLVVIAVVVVEGRDIAA